MDREALAVARLDRVIWAIIALVAAAVIAASMASNFQLAWAPSRPRLWLAAS
jgi:hypothetical protein